MPQIRNSVPNISVRTLVEHGRFPHMGFGRKMSAEDMEAVHRAMDFAGVTEHADKMLHELSGGVRQRVYLAMQLAQDCEYMVFERNNRGVILTEKGTELLAYAKQVVNQYELIEEKYINGDEEKKFFSVSMQHYVFALHAFINTILKEKHQVNKLSRQAGQKPRLIIFTADVPSSLPAKAGLSQQVPRRIRSCSRLCLSGSCGRLPLHRL